MERLIVAAGAEREIDADDGDFLGAGEQTRVGGHGRARRHGLGIAEIIGLIDVLAVDVGGGEAGLYLGIGVRQ